MRNLEFKEELLDYSHWRDKLIQSIELYREWRRYNKFNDEQSNDTILSILQSLRADRVTLAFVAEFSRGKTELINALFFAETGVRLLPSSPGRTTMSPTELFWDQKGGSYIRLLDIETRLEDTSLLNYKSQLDCWTQIDLDCDSPTQMQEAFKSLIATKQVSKDKAYKLGLWNEREAAEQGNINPEYVEIPCWRHALISFPHPLLKEGLCILDTPGLNALGCEPELTLNILPSAQAIIFVLAADTGVTKSDLEMWNSHVCNASGQQRQGLAVVMNKIDSMWDDLAENHNCDAAIQNQIQSTASILNIDQNFIFAVSAKQGLLAKIRNDADLLEKSRLQKLENYLSKDILDQRRNILTAGVRKEIGYMVSESLKLMETKIVNAEKQLKEFKQIDFNNQEMTEKLMAETREHQSTYLLNVENFQASRKVFAVQARMLINSFANEKIDEIIKRTRVEMDKSLTTFGLKQSIRKLFDELRDLLQDSLDITDETRRLVKAIHKKFRDDYGFNEIEPELFSIKYYQFELEQIFAEGDAFRNSARTTMTEQSVVINKLYTTLIYKARYILQQAYRDSAIWSNSVLNPLIHQIKDHKIQIEGRLQMLKKINQSKDMVAVSIAQLEAELAPIKLQRQQLVGIIKAMHFEVKIN
ncbi:dynamin family protein [Methylomonas sp. AM2-LC]|uniref:dynamin family protein n=1 Tax=Methylomonas sp. AM2-LC TaxID=3153301 RepID=UPI0032671011